MGRQRKLPREAKCRSCGSPSKFLPGCCSLTGSPSNLGAHAVNMKCVIDPNMRADATMLRSI
eukprot:1866958-Pyramimonas_sp.AAC.1